MENKLMVKERPILFSGPMVRAILDGRKTQTRRIVKPQPCRLDDPENVWKRDYLKTGCPLAPPSEKCGVESAIFCPYGYPGDRLWVRETWTYGTGPTDGSKPNAENSIIVYREDWERRCPGTPLDGAWRPSIFMPRWACRIMLEIVSVRVEPLQQISGADAKAEGVAPRWLDVNGRDVNAYSAPTYRQGFAGLWDSINAKRGFGWDKNPFVWVIEFKVLEINKGEGK